MYNSQDTRETILQLLKNRGSNASKMVSEIGLNNSFITDMQRKNAMPSGDKLGKIADYLDVSVDYLLGRTDKPEVNR